MCASATSSGNALQSQLEDLSAQLADAIEASPSHSAYGHSSRQSRHRVASIAKAIVNTVTLPEERWLDQSTTFCEILAIRLFMHWGVFDLIPAEGSVSYEELASHLNADPSLINRIGWVLVATGVLDQVFQGSVAHTGRSRIYVKHNPYGCLFMIMVDNGLIPSATLMKYFDIYGRKEPVTTNHTPLCFAMGEPDTTAWDLFAKDPERLRVFLTGMKVLENFMPVTGTYDFTWVVGRSQECHEERILLVDIGGSQGHATAAICSANPGILKRRCVLQDLPEVLDEVRIKDPEEIRGVQLMPVDFHREQPVKGALIYYIRHCLHDYSDDRCTIILKHIADAMAPDSRLLIVENVLQDPPSSESVWLDFLMLNVGGKERTYGQWDSIISNAGLKISGVFKGATSPHGTIECTKTEK
ncbi:S-adenosyl-L-methionine-dependent methyltransferase [Aspergillus nidulans var. acristatus]